MKWVIIVAGALLLAAFAAGNGPGRYETWNEQAARCYDSPVSHPCMDAPPQWVRK